ncbi:MAG: hypothetical protein ABH845_01720, partial [Candidatus Omnitrophota bacterium]
MMKPPSIKLPTSTTFHGKQALSYVSYAIGVSEKPGPFAALCVGNRSLIMAEVKVKDGTRTILGHCFQEISIPDGLT